MTSCCPPPRMRWSGATDAIARCKRVSTGCGRKPSSAHAWRWICGVKPKGQGATKPSTPYMRHGLPEVTRYPCYSLEVNNILPVSESNFPPHHSKIYTSNKTYTIIFFNKLHVSTCVYACCKAICM